MKKKMFISIIVGIFAIVSISFAVINDYWPDGWTSSNGLNSVPGDATNVIQIPGGYSFYCEPSPDICYSINGPNLFINGNLSMNGGGDIDLFRK